ncbi:PbH1 [Seminavis robusta]|uniref:PbH1 n=1 Tax=Seminavis robusta TaxID=568900 RepID=A0A9N8ETN4_9STRA|nr:PbH1 [Seminavis robusta]|eukprot:Sro1662_g289410.1 PbH1 (847) ;mRNA; r:14274-18972
MKIVNSLRFLLVGLVGVATASPASDVETGSHHPSSKVNLTDLSSLKLKGGEAVQDEQGHKEEELPTIAELVENQKASIQVDREVNLRHRLLSGAGQIRPVFGNNGKCSNQKFTYDSSTKQIKVDGKCLDDKGSGDRNVYAHTCHNGNNQKWRTDNKGRIQVLSDYKCLDVTSGRNLYMRGCCDNCEGQRWYVPQHFPTTKSEIHPVLSSAACWDVGGTDKNLYVNGNCHNGDNQQFYYSPYSESIFLPLADGSGCLDENGSTGNVYAFRCHHGNNQKWWMDSYGRIRNRHDTSRCMEQHSSGNNLRMVGCNDNDNQRFIVPHETFPVAASQVKPFYDLGKCWDSGTNKNLYLASSCSSGNFHQQFYFMAQSERIYDAYGNGCLDDDGSSARNVYSHRCHGGSNQKWYADSLGRLRGRKDNKCLTIDSNNLVMKDCNDSIYQRFVVPASFPRVTSPVKSVFNTGLCLAAMSDRKVMARSCRGDKDEDFFYVPDSQRIFVASGQGCLDPTVNNNVIVHPCHGQNNQKWYMDDRGRIRDKQYHHCLTRASNNNLEHRGCDDKDSQRLVLPESFPVSTSIIKPFNNANLCWGLASDNTNMMIVSCSSSQNFFFVPESGRIIHLPSGKCVDDAGNGGRNVYLGSCHNGNNQKFFVDDKARIHTRRDGKCIDINTDNNLFVKDCNDDDSQRFIYPISFKTILSPVTPYADQTKCWDIGGINLYLHPCHKGRNQDFVYIPSTEQIMAGHGTGCLTDESSGGRSVFFGTCGTGNNQKWYMDAQGRLHSRIDEIKCLDLNKSNNNLYMEVCNDSFSQRFSYPNSFPIVTTNARTAYDRRQELNRIYGTVDRHIYG